LEVTNWEGFCLNLKAFIRYHLIFLHLSKLNQMAL